MTIAEHALMLALMRKAADAWGSRADTLRHDSPFRQRCEIRESVLDRTIKVLEEDLSPEERAVGEAWLKRLSVNGPGTESSSAPKT